MANLSLSLFLSEYIISLKKTIKLLKNPQRDHKKNMEVSMKKETMVTIIGLKARMSRESRKAHVAKVEEEAEVVKVAREAKMARVAEVAEVTRVALVARVVTVEEVARVVSVVANDKENQLKMASSHSLGINCIFTHQSSEFLLKFLIFLFLFTSLVLILDFNHSKCLSKFGLAMNLLASTLHIQKYPPFF